METKNLTIFEMKYGCQHEVTKHFLVNSIFGFVGPIILILIPLKYTDYNLFVSSYLFHYCLNSIMIK